eukprot:7496401-Pyramimonas_sp.AAC.1
MGGNGGRIRVTDAAARPGVLSSPWSESLGVGLQAGSPRLPTFGGVGSSGPRAGCSGGHPAPP